MSRCRRMSNRWRSRVSCRGRASPSPAAVRSLRRAFSLVTELERADRHIQAGTISGMAIGVLIVAGGGSALWRLIKAARQLSGDASQWAGSSLCRGCGGSECMPLSSVPTSRHTLVGTRRLAGRTTASCGCRETRVGCTADLWQCARLKSLGCSPSRSGNASQKAPDRAQADDLPFSRAGASRAELPELNKAAAIFGAHGLKHAIQRARTFTPQPLRIRIIFSCARSRIV